MSSMFCVRHGGLSVGLWIWQSLEILLALLHTLERTTPPPRPNACPDFLFSEFDTSGSILVLLSASPSSSLDTVYALS